MNLPAIKDEMDEYAKGLLYQIIPNKSFSNVCYTYRISNKLAGSVYKIALNDALPEELKEWLKTIEFCHIKRQHYAAKQTLDFRFSAPKIKAVYNRLKPLFDDPVSDIDNMYDIFEDYIFKMLRDWEVFTNDFTEDEVRYLDTLYPDECIIDGQPVVHLLPQDVGYPPGLTANEYLLLILQNPEQWFTNQMSAMQQAMDDLKQRKQNNGTQGGCNTNQSGAASSGGGADDMNHNKEDRERPKKNPPQNQQGGQNGQKGGQSGQQNQQPQNQQGSQNGQNQNGQNQNGQDDQGMGSSQQNQDAAANTQQQEWKDGKDSNGGSNGSSGKQSNNDKSKQTDSSSKGSGKGGSDDKSEQDGQSGGGSSDAQKEGVDNEQNQSGGGSSNDKTAGEDKNSDGDTSGGSGSQEEVEDAGTQDESRSGGSSSNDDKGNSDDADGENQAGGSGTSDEDNGEDGSESESSNSGDAASDDNENGEDTSGEASGKEGSETADGEPSDDGSEGSDSDASDAEDGSGERRELTKEELDELIKQFVQKAVSDYQKMLEIKDEQEADSNSLKGYSRDSGGGAGNGTVLVDKCTNWIDFEGLEKEIRELMINRCVTVSKRDLLYNYNRGRGCGDVLTPRYREQTTYDEVPMTVILDVSGSISDKNILGFCNIFKNVSKTCGKKCKIVMWDTGLRAIYDSGDDIKAVSGGGTDIGAGIDYVRKNFQPSEIGNLFVVSDCEDDLEDWSLEGFEQPYLVCWSSMDVIEHYTGSLFNEFVDSFEKILVKK